MAFFEIKINKLLLFVLVQSNAPIVVFYGPQHSSLRAALIKHLITVEDITLVLLSIEEHLWRWLDSYSSHTIASLIIQPTVCIQRTIVRSHDYTNVRSILVRCTSTDLTSLLRFSRSYPKVDGVFADDIRILIKLVIDLTLFSEELGDKKRALENNEIEAQRNYDRALKFCELVRKL